VNVGGGVVAIEQSAVHQATAGGDVDSDINGGSRTSVNIRIIGAYRGRRQLCRRIFEMATSYNVDSINIGCKGIDVSGVARLKLSVCCRC